MMLFLALLLSLVSLVSSTPVTPPCDQPYHERVDAFDEAWDLGECEQRGFCWNEGPSDVPWCYLPREVEGYATAAECSAASAAGNRRGCAFEDGDINPHTCTAKGCCWAPGTSEEDPWCFAPAGYTIEGQQREEM